MVRSGGDSEEEWNESEATACGRVASHKNAFTQRYNTRTKPVPESTETARTAGRPTRWQFRSRRAEIVAIGCTRALLNAQSAVHRVPERQKASMGLLAPERTGAK